MAEKVLQDMKLSPQEMGRFAKAMKDPHFTKLFEEYAREISEPMNREEAESYVKFVEERSKSDKKFFMEGKELVLSTPDFCLKTKDKKTGCKFFINICHSSKLEKPKSNTKKDGSGVYWHIPYSLSPIHRDKDKGGAACSTVDYIVNEEVCKKCKESKRFKLFVTETAVESVEKQYKLDLERGIVFPKLKYKGPTNHPKMMTIPSNSKLVATGPKAGETTGSNKEEILAQTLSNRGFGANKKPEKEGKELDKIEEMLREPEYDILYRNGMDMGKFWMDSTIDSTTEFEKPQDIILRVLLPEVMSSCEVELDISDTEALLKVPGIYKLKVKWKYRVDSAKGSAKFDKASRKLEVILPVRVSASNSNSCS